MSLYQRFLAARKESSAHRHIITDASISSILTPDCVRNLLRDEVHVEPHLVDEYAELTCKQAIKILSILICIGHVSALVDHFLHRSLFDKKLPLGHSELQEDFRKAFLSEQYHFLAPDFILGAYHDWSSNVILPFALDQPIGADAGGEGGFACVYKIEIIPEFQKLVDASNTGKEKTRRSGGSAPAFRQEKRVLELLSLVNHPNIVRLLASYVYDDIFNMIFPLADGNLEEVLSQSRFMHDAGKLAVLHQIYGITSAINALHNFQMIGEQGLDLSKSGYHHDLKPQNILVKDGIFLLADFGLARLKNEGVDSITNHKYGTYTYGGPETTQPIASGHSQVGRALDIWSWGCIITEIITFTLLGSSKVINFRSARKTVIGMREDSSFHDTMKVKPQVLKWQQMLYEQASSICDNLHKNLVVDILETVKLMIVADPSRRLSSLQVLQRFDTSFHQHGAPSEILARGDSDSDAIGFLDSTREVILSDPTSFQEEVESVLERMRTVLNPDHLAVREMERLTKGLAAE
ncbi:hypothetical protein MMC22_004613 [Lobaria immixta]|nr:hypothetical protein [Lobaria immixta]